MSFTTVNIIILIWLAGWAILSFVGIFRSLFLKKTWYNLIVWFFLIGFWWPIIGIVYFVTWFLDVWSKANTKDL